MRAAILTALLVRFTGTPAVPPASGTPGDARTPNGARKAEDAVERIRALYKRVNNEIPSDPSLVLCMNDAGTWTKVSGKKPPADCAPVALVFRLEGAVRKAIITEDSEAGDWTSVAEHYFYPDGRLAFRFERLTSFEGSDPQIPDGPSGPFIVETRTYFDEAGQRIRELKKAFFQPTGKPIPISAVAQPDTTHLRSADDLADRNCE